MASPISSLSFCSSTSVKNNNSTMYALTPCSCSYYSTKSIPKTLKVSLFSRLSQMGLSHFTPWNGLRHMGISISTKPQKIGSRGKCKGKVVHASLFGVGAPEALVIGAVALLVFGPKGLAEVARNLGKTLRTFQPTIRELQEVSREFKNTLEREISLDDDPSPTSNMYESSKVNTSNQSAPTVDSSQNVPVVDSNGTANNAYSSEEYLKITEEQLKASAANLQNTASSPQENEIELGNQPQDNNPEAYSSENNLEVTGEQLEPSIATATQQDVTPLPPQKVTGEQLEASIATATQQDVTPLPPQNQIEVESQPQPQAVGQESATIAPPEQKPN